LQIKYVESLTYIYYYHFRKPGLTIEPKERGGEVTIQQFIKPCMFVDLP